MVAVALSVATGVVHAELVGGPYVMQTLDINGGGTTSTGGPYSISASTGQAGGVGTITAEPVPAPPLYQFDDGFWSTVGPCNTAATCHDDSVCTCDACANGFCQYTSISYGNVNCVGPVNQADLDDILCVLDGFANFDVCPNADIAPTCAGDGGIDLDDILAVLDAFGGADPCGCGP